MRTLFPWLLLVTLVQPAHAKKPPPPVNGIPVCTATGNQNLHAIASDGAGGFYSVWLDDRTPPNSDVYLQHLRSDGTVAPGWPVNGLALTTGALGAFAFVHEDGAGGALVVWRPGNEIRAQRVDAGGTIHAGWPAGGKVITSGFYDTPFASAPDGHGGCWIGWVMTLDGNWENAMVSRIDADGTIVPPWSAAGSYLGTDEQIRFLTLAPDPSDGVVYAFGTYFNGIVDQVHSRVGRLASDGSSSVSSSLYYGQRNWQASAIADRQGGVFTAFTSQTLNPPSSGSWAQRVDETGTRAWPESLAVPFGTVLVSDEGTGAYLLGFEGATLVARRRLEDGALAGGWTPSGLALASPGNRGQMDAIATSTGFVACWAESAAGLDLRAVGVQSNGTLAPGWPAGGTPVIQAPGDQSAFRLLASDSGEVWVVWSDDRNGSGNRDIYATHVGPNPAVGIEPGVPGASSMAFRSIAPNPVRDVVRIELALPANRPVTIELVDLRGRVLSRRAGAATTTLSTRGLAPGLYWLRAIQDGVSATARIAVVR